MFLVFWKFFYPFLVKNHKFKIGQYDRFGGQNGRFDSSRSFWGQCGRVLVRMAVLGSKKIATLEMFPDLTLDLEPEDKYLSYEPFSFCSKRRICWLLTFSWLFFFFRFFLTVFGWFWSNSCSTTVFQSLTSLLFRSKYSQRDLVKSFIFSL